MDRQTKYSCASELTGSLKDFSQGSKRLRNLTGDDNSKRYHVHIHHPSLYGLLNFGKQDRNSVNILAIFSIR